MIATYKFDELIPAIQAVMPHAAGSRETTQVITGVRIDADGSLVATDRYTVARYKPDFFETVASDGIGDDAFEGFTLSSAAVTWLSKIKGASLSIDTRRLAPGQGYHVRFITDGDAKNVAIEIAYDGGSNVEMSATFPLLAGNYPPVARLFPDGDTPFRVVTEVTALSLNMNFLMRVQKAVKALDPRGSGCAEFRFMPTENPNKPGPVYARVGDRFDCLVQPNLLRSR